MRGSAEPLGLSVESVSHWLSSDVHMELSIFDIFRVFFDRVISATIHNIPSNIFPLNNVVSRVGYAWYIRKVWWWTLGQRWVTALHQEFTVVDYACPPRGGREKRSPGSCTIIGRQLRLIRKGHSANWNDFVGGLLDRWVPWRRHGRGEMVVWMERVQLGWHRTRGAVN